tara:strand:- start:2002 stop:2202 length:201 start_codon:yes stop_codon:yes gene_type:complete
MKTELDKETDSAYIYLKDKINEGEVTRTIAINENIVLDFSSDNKLLGIEVLNASKNLAKLPEKLAV